MAKMMKQIKIDRNFIHEMGTRRQKRTLFKSGILWLQDQSFPYSLGFGDYSFGLNKMELGDMMGAFNYLLQRMFDENG